VAEKLSLVGAEMLLPLAVFCTGIDLADGDSDRLVPADHLMDEQEETDLLE
jgi:hypothetical protein